MKPVTLTLQLRRETTSQPVTAGWLPSPSPEVWHTEATRLRKAGLSKSPGIIPITLDGITHGAILLLPEDETAPFSRRVSPLTRLLPNVLSLQNAELSLGLLEQEICFSNFPADFYLFLPHTGLLELSKTSILASKDFIILEKSPTTWNHALPGPLPQPRLGAIILKLPDPEDLHLESDGVGDLKGKKPKGKGPLGKIGKIGKGLGLGLGALAAGPILGLGKLLNFLPNGPASNTPTPFEKLEAWAQKHWKDISSARQRELNRLIEMMAKDPEQGLRYALPLGGHEARRGKAASGWKLGQRSLRLGNSQGGGAVDGWDLDHETQLKLEQQYRKAAAAAEADGNHERAAYIYGELLNDWASAAHSLIKAGKLREAVSIFLNKLSDMRRAAQALEEAGFHLQAAEWYFNLQDFEKVGDLYQHLGQENRAREFWNKALDEEKNPLEKARISEEKLGSRIDAIAILDKAWRSNQHAATSLQAEFKLLLKNEDQSAIENLITEFDAAPPSIFPALEKARLCLSLRQELLPEVHHAPLQESVLRLTSAKLGKDPSAKSSHQFLNLLKQFREEDELLNRDTTRYIAGSKTIKISPTQRPRGHLTPDFELGIPHPGKWQSLASLGDKISIAGIGAGSLIAAQLHGRSCMGSELATNDFPPASHGVFHLGLLGNPHKARVFHFYREKKIHFRSLNTKRTSDHNALGIHKNVLSIGPVGSEGFMILQYNSTGSLVFHHYLTNGTKFESTVLDLVPPELADARWFCASRDNHTCFSAENFAAWRSPDGQFASCQLNEPINKLTLSPGSHPLHALISSQHEAALLTPTKNGKVPEFVNLSVSDSEHPLASTFAHNGDALIASGSRGEIFSPSKLGEPIATFGFPKELGHAIDIAPNGPTDFVVLTSKGRLILFK